MDFVFLKKTVFALDGAYIGQNHSTVAQETPIGRIFIFIFISIV